MKPKSVMIIAGEASGDAIAAQLVKALAVELPLNDSLYPPAAYQPLTAPFSPRFFGAGGPKMAEAGVELAVDMTANSVIGISDVFKKLPHFFKTFDRLLKLATEREPDLIVLVDFAGFNRRFAHAVRNWTRSHRGPFYNWQPKIVQYVSPQVWASRPGRANKMAQDIDLLLCLFPFEKEWYAKRVPELKVECVGNPIFERYQNRSPAVTVPAASQTSAPVVLLLPGSRGAELRRHLPPMLDAARQIAETEKVRFQMVLPNERLLKQAKSFDSSALANLEIRIGGLADALQQATVAIASTGTVTLECAFFGVPTVAIYKTSWSTYLIGRSIINVNYLAMPNLLANERVYPELIQHDATAGNIARETISLWKDSSARQAIQTKLQKIISELGGPGASHRAAQAIARLMSR